MGELDMMTLGPAFNLVQPLQAAGTCGLGIMLSARHILAKLRAEPSSQGIRMSNIGQEYGLLTPGAGDERYSLCFPYVRHLHSLRLPAEVLRAGVENQVGVPVIYEERGGYELLRLGPFSTEEAAKKAFRTLLALFDRIIARHSYPVSFQRTLLPIYKPPHGIKLLDGRLIDAYAHLACPTILPEHRLIFDNGVMLAKVHPQVQPNVLEATLEEPLHPLLTDDVTCLALDCYVTACASDQRALQVLGMVVTLEVMAEKTQRDGKEVDALLGFVAMLQQLPEEMQGKDWKAMRTLLVERIPTFKWLSKSKVIAAMIESNSAAVVSALGADHPWIVSPGKATDIIYSLRSKIAHAGMMSSSLEEARVADDLKRLTGALLEAKLNRPEPNLQ
jgi:hypothetical protein